MADMRMVTNALDRVATRMTPRLKQAARVGGWPDDVVESLTLVRDESGMLMPQFNGDPEVMQTLEYGDHNNPPKPVLNNFFNNYFVQSKIRKETTTGMKEFHAFTQRLFA